MPEFTKDGSSLKQFKDNLPVTKLGLNPFVNKDTGRTYLPSLFTAEEEKQFKINRNFKQRKYLTLQDSVSHIYSYFIADDYNYVMTQLSDHDLYWLKFIARFKSIQQVQLFRQTALYPDWFDRKSLKHSLDRLFMYGLIWKWNFKRDFLNKPVTAYTLSVNGFRFMEYFFNQERRYFQPQSYFTLPVQYHIRFWETVDIYQLCLSLPIFHGFETFLNLGKDKENKIKRNMTSPLQIALEMIPNQIKNLVFFPALQTDDLTYYQNALLRWNAFTDDGADLTESINGLPGTQNIIVFYAPTVAIADKLNADLELPNWNFPIFLLVGSVIEKEGITQAFYYPDHRNKTLDLQRATLPNLVFDNQESDGRNEED